MSSAARIAADAVFAVTVDDLLFLSETKLVDVLQKILVEALKFQAFFTLWGT